MYFHDPFFTLFAYTLAFIVETEHSNANSDRNILKIFRAKQDEKFDKLVVHNNGRWVYVGAETQIYQLSADLESQVASFKLEENGYENIILELDYQNEQLISCNDACYIHDITNVSHIIKKFTQYEFGDINAVNEPIAFVAPSSQKLSALYYGFAVASDRIYIRNLKRGEILSDREIFLKLVRYRLVKFIYGYNSGDVSYFLANGISVKYITDAETFITSIGSRAGYLMEIQHKNDEYTDILITCGYDFTNTMRLQRAYFYEYESDSEWETDLHKKKRKILFTIFSVGTSTSEFRVCKYHLDRTYSFYGNHRMLDGEPIIYHHVGETGVTAMTVDAINDHIVLFFGTNKGHLHKVSIREFDSPDARSTNTYADITIDEGSPIDSDMLFDSKKKYLYVMTKNKLAKVKIYNCNEHNTSYSCLSAKDPYCGWCFRNNRCCLKSECNNNERNSNKWISHDIKKYVNEYRYPNTKYSKTVESKVTFYLSNSHPFYNHIIICSFRFNNTIINTTTNVGNENQINCATPNPKDFPATPINEHFVEAHLSLQTKDFPEFQNMRVEFIDCGTYKLCSECSTYPCMWYVNKQKCTDRRIGHSNDIEQADNPNSSNGCDGSCLTKKIYSLSKGTCPQFNIMNGPLSHVYIHADTEKNETITLDYSILTEFIDETFTCKFDIEGNEIRKPVHMGIRSYGSNGLSTGTIECDETTFTYATQTANITVNLSVLWNGSTYLENMSNRHIILYKCANMGDQCATCLDKNYTCIFNSKTGECKYDDNSTNVDLDINNHWWNDTKKCSNVIITHKITETHWLIENIHWIIIIIVVITSTIITIFIIVYRKKAKVSQKMQRQINKMGMEMIAMSQWVKRVVIENEIELDENESNMLKLPNVTIVYTSTPRTAENDTTSQTEYEIPLDEKWEIPRDNLVLGKCLGEGEFGRVVEGNVTGLLQQDVVTTVAVKMLKNIHSDIDMINLVMEMELMKLIDRHENVLSLLGCCTRDGPLYIITEYSPHGNLLDFLRNHHRPSKTLEILPEKVLITFALQVARGMKYMASIKCIHRDLAARNVLVFDNYNVKIADFGLARDIRHDYYYRQKTKGRLPVKWMAPETLIKKRYTTQSDVWSYGVLLWEIMSFGSVPYLAYEDAEKLLEDIQAGYRMKKPDGCSIMMYCLMCKCWNYLPEDRPEFSKIIADLKALMGNDAIIEYPNSDCSDSDCSDSDSSNSTISRHIMKNETDALLENNNCS